jgi:hypothetical protein
MAKAPQGYGEEGRLKLEVGKTYKTRGMGLRVEIIGKLKNGEFIGILTDKDGDEGVETFQPDGRYDPNQTSTTLDLVSEAKKKVVAYINVYGNDNEVQGIFWARQEADVAADRGRTACIRVEFEDGQYDD